VLSEHGRLFPLRGAPMPAGLPLFDGPDSRVADVVALYNKSRTLFAPGGLAVRSVALDRRGSWSLVLSNSTEVIVGSQEPQTRLTRFARLLPQLLSQKQQPLARADLRYTNGFALSWASDRKQADAKASAAGGERPAMDGRAGRSGANDGAPRMAAVTRGALPQHLEQAGT
jgi:cell division protein FtsQ